MKTNMNKTFKDIILAVLFLFITLIVVGYVFIVILNITGERMYIQCCYDMGGEMIITGRHCPVPSNCAYCSMDIDINKDCSYNLTNEVNQHER